jgi:D-serine deaminase-like pyridoxal phosphate-dependent protein
VPVTGVSRRTVHAHVERFVALETEAAARRVELHRRNAEVGERAVDHRNLPLVEDVGDRAVVGVDELDAVAPRRERFGGAGEGIEVAIESNQPRRSGFEQRAGVAAETDRAVDEEAAVFGAEKLQNLGGHDRHVRHQIPNSASARASSSVYGSRCSFAAKRSWFHTSR